MFNAGDEVETLGYDFTSHPGAVEALKEAGFSEDEMLGTSKEPSTVAVIAWLEEFNTIVRLEARHQRERSNELYNELAAIDVRSRDDAKTPPADAAPGEPETGTEAEVVQHSEAALKKMSLDRLKTLAAERGLPHAATDGKANLVAVHLRYQRAAADPDKAEADKAEADAAAAASNADVLDDADLSSPAAAAGTMSNIASHEPELARRVSERLIKGLAELLGGRPSEKFIRALPWRVRLSFQAHIQKELSDPTRGNAASSR